nr:MAG: hypothetical protein [Bacteriophage sp.]
MAEGDGKTTNGEVDHHAERHNVRLKSTVENTSDGDNTRNGYASFPNSDANHDSEELADNQSPNGSVG